MPCGLEQENVPAGMASGEKNTGIDALIYGIKIVKPNQSRCNIRRSNEPFSRRDEGDEAY